MSRNIRNSRRLSAARRPRRGFRALRLEPLEDRRVLAALSLASLHAAGVIIYGVEATDQSGIAVSHAGDVNGDGFDDVVIGARYADALNNAKPSAGESYLIFGKANWSTTRTIDLANLGTAGVTIYGANVEDYSGRAVSNAGDINGDGFDDLLIGAGGGDAANNAKPNAGESYVIFGKSNWSATPTIDLANLGTAGIVLYGEDAFDLSGRAVSSAGDVNGDGYDDLLIGALGGDSVSNLRSNAGETALVFGKPDWSATPVVDLDNLGAGGVTIYGVNGGDNSGLGISRGGDVNGDGFDDLLIGARYGDALNNAKGAAGESYVVFGKGDWSATLTLDLANLGAAGITLFGADIDDYSGLSVSDAGDVNGDGFDDLLIGAVGGDGVTELRPRSGESYLVFGKANWASTPTVDLGSLGNAGITFFGADDLDNSGLGVSAAGDVNGDGFDDLLIGARYADAENNLKTSAGDSYVVFGRASWSNLLNFQLGNLANSGITIRGAEAFDYSGYSVSGGGDINGDGFDDILLGAATADAEGNAKPNAGETYIVFGGDQFTSSVTHPGSPLNDTLTGTVGGNIMVGGQGNDLLVGAGGEDVLRGGSGNDILAVGDLNFRRIVGGRGTDTLRLDTSGTTLDLTAWPDNRIQGIERIDIRGTGANTLTFNVREVLNLSDESNTLIVLRNANDTVNRGAGWVQQPNEIIDGAVFEVFTQGAAVLKVQFDVADLTVAMTSSVSSVLAGGSFFYTATVNNGGPVTATGVVVTDVLPLGLAFDGSNSSAHCTASGQLVTCTIGSIAQGGSSSSRIGVRVSSGVAHASILANTATATHNESDPTPGDLSSTAMVTVNRQADVKIAKLPSANPVPVGTGFHYTMQVINSGPSDASGVIVTDQLPAGLTFDPIRSTSICTAVGQAVTCNLGNMTAGSSSLPQVAVTVDPALADGAIITNTAELTSQEADPTTGDHSSTVPVTVTRQADLRLVKTASSNPVLAGGLFAYTVRVENRGPAQASGVVVTDTLPAGLALDPATSSPGCSAVGQVVTCTIGNLAVNSDVMVALGVLVGAAVPRRTSLTNSATVSGDAPDASPGNETATVTVVVNVDPDPFPWQNVRDPFDVNNDRAVTPIDALVVVNELNGPKFRNALGQLPLPPPVATHPYLDVSGDNFVVPGDVLQIVNFLNSLLGGEGEAQVSEPGGGDGLAAAGHRGASAWGAAAAPLAPSPGGAALPGERGTRPAPAATPLPSPAAVSPPSASAVDVRRSEGEPQARRTREARWKSPADLLLFESLDQESLDAIADDVAVARGRLGPGPYGVEPGRP